MNEILTPEQRLRRIAEIINKGIYLLALEEGWFPIPVKPKKEKITQTQALNFEEQQIIDLCKKRGSITNKHVQDLLGVHRNTATRKLKEMALRQLLHQKGMGKGSFYILNPDFTKIGSALESKQGA